jgi:HprK-related kinase A
MIVRDLATKELGQRLAGHGLRVRTGPVLTQIRSRIPAVAEGIALLYAEHPVEEENEFADFRVSIESRRMLKRQVVFRFDGHSTFNPLPAEQAFPLLEWGLNWCITTHCHQYLIVHAAVVERCGSALLLPGGSGSGKSTLCAALISRGWRLFSDELALIDPASTEIVPLPRPISLKNGAIEAIRRAASQSVLSPAVCDTAKGSVAYLKPPAESVRRAQQHARASWIVFPRYDKDRNAHKAPLSKGRAFMRLAECAFNYDVLGIRGFDVLADVVGGTACYEIGFGKLGEALSAIESVA